MKAKIICFVLTICAFFHLFPMFCIASEYDFSHITSNNDFFVFDKINDVRKSNGKLPFSTLTSLQNAAKTRSNELSNKALATHTRPDGSQWISVLNECGYKYDDVFEVSEKFVVSTGSLSAVTNALLSDTTTKALILNSDFGHLGCSFSSNSKNALELIFGQCKANEIDLYPQDLSNRLVVGNSLERSGLEVELTCNHGKSYLPLYDCLYTEFSKNQVGKQTVSLSYGDITKQVDVYVNFSDVKIDSWYYQGVKNCFDKGLFSGTSDSTFSPSMPTTRAMFVTILARLDSVNKDDYTDTSFVDVPVGKWYTPYVEWATKIGIAKGTGNNKFSPDLPITREQLCVMLKQYSNIKDYSIQDTVSNVSFNDDSKISSWAKDSVSFCQRKGFVAGDTYGNFNPKNNATRAESSLIFFKFDQAISEE